MYPALTFPLLVPLAVAAAALLWLVIRRPVIRRLAMRQVSRRRTEGALVIAGSILGTAIIVGALVVGDTLGFSVRQTAYQTLGNVDERVVSSSSTTGAAVAARLSALAASNNIDGVLTARVQQASASFRTPSGVIAEPRVLAWDLDFAAASRFGSAGAPSGLGGPAPAADQVVVNKPLADSLHVRPGAVLTLFLDGRSHQFTVARIVPERGLAGTGFGAIQNRNVFLPSGQLATSGAAGGTQVVTLISNRGDVESGNKLTAQVTAQIKQAIDPITGAVIDTPKKEVLLAAKKTGDSLGALFLMIGSFSIIAGALLLMNIFVMLGEERKTQLGMLRAVGLKRRHLVGCFSLEGAVYALAATLLGVGLGVAVGRGVAFVAARIFSTWTTDGSGLTVTFAVSGRSLVNGAALGLVIALATILVTSLRISRFNIISAIRDLPAASGARTKRRFVVAGAVLSAFFAALSVPVVARSDAVGSFLLPSLSMICLAPLLSRSINKRWSYTIISILVLGWSLLVNVVRPRIYDSPSMAVYVVMGSLLAGSAVVLISENQSLVLRPLRRFLSRPTEGALAARLAVAYPVAKRFRTGATLIMYTLIFLVLVLLTEIGGVLSHSISSQVANSTAGYGLRLDFNPTSDVLAQLRSARVASDLSQITPLVSANGRAADPGRRTTELVDALAVGVPDNTTNAMQFEKRLAGLSTDAQVWRAVAEHPNYVVLDPFFAATGGPAGQYYKPGDAFVLTNPQTGRTVTKKIVGILRNATIFYSPMRPMAFPVVMNPRAVTELFGRGAVVSSAFMRTVGPETPTQLAAQLQGSYLSASLVATPVATTIRRMFNASLAFFRLMEGFLALGLLIGICGLGVVMVRAVRERRRTIGVLRALGFRARTVERSFLIESGFVAFEGVVLGSGLGILTTWLMYQKSAAFSGIHAGFPVLWGTAGVLALITLVMSLLATAGPARRAAHILPALATRVVD